MWIRETIICIGYQISARITWCSLDESGSDKRAGFRRTGWSPRAVAPVQISRFQRGQRYQILPAYCQDGILMSGNFQGLADASIFEDFIEQLLQHCARWPGPKSVLIMDNVSFHYTGRIEKLVNHNGYGVQWSMAFDPLGDTTQYGPTTVNLCHSPSFPIR
jgi:hypothetical protein